MAKMPMVMSIAATTAAMAIALMNAAVGR